MNDLLAKLRCLGPLLQQLNAQEAASAVADAINQMIELEVLRVENGALRKDAERYRWLRAEGVSYYSTGIIPDLVWQGPDWHDIDGPEKLDQAIDAAMNGANG